MPAERSERSTRSTVTSDAANKPRKTKNDKIIELESNLKLAKEENRGLKKDIAKLRSAEKSSGEKSRSPPSSADGIDLGDIDKLKDSLKALRRVHVNQEKSLKTLRDKSHQRRKQLKDKDSMIHSLQRQVRSLQKAMHANGGESEMQAKLGEMQRTCFEVESKNLELEDLLTQSEQDARHLQKQLSAGGGLRRAPSNGSLKSVESSASTSTASEFDFAKLRKELAIKTNKILQLEMQLESVNDDMYEIQRKKKTESAFGSADPFVVNRKGSGDNFADFAAANFEDSAGFDDSSEFQNSSNDLPSSRRGTHGSSDFNASGMDFYLGSDEEDSEEDDNFW